MRAKRRFYPRAAAPETARARRGWLPALRVGLAAAALGAACAVAAAAEPAPTGPARSDGAAATRDVPADPAAGAKRREAIAALASESAEVRRRAVVALADIGVEQDAPPLLDALHDADPDVRDAADAALWQVWSRSGDPETDRLLALGIEQMSNASFDAAIETFSGVIARRPAFAEGWNKRATVHFLNGDYRASLADCDEVMRRNPRHFGALAGYGQIYVALGQLERALDYFRRALAINPTMDGVATNIELLEALIARRRGRGV